MPQAHPELANALRWLRHRSGLTQSEVAEAVEQAGGHISEVYLRKCEKGTATPSASMLDNLLSALGSDPAEMEALLQSPPWTTGSGRTADRYRITRSLPRTMARSALTADASFASVNATAPALLASTQLQSSPAASPAMMEASEILAGYGELTRTQQVTLYNLFKSFGGR